MAHWIGCPWKTYKEFTLTEKFTAYGALFYLITPFDFIPDYTPIFGLVDDYAILGFATVFYLKKFPAVVFKKIPSIDAL